MNNKKGFTLIELLIVIAILGILTLLAVSTFLGHSNKALEVSLRHDAKLIQKASTNYHLKNQEYPYLLENGRPVEIGPNGMFEILYKVEDFDDNNKNVIFYEIDFDKLKPYVDVKTDYGYFVAAVGNPDFGITALDPKDKKTHERLKRDDKSTQTEDVSNEAREALDDEIEINSVEDLNAVRNKLDGKYILMSNIDLSSIDNWIPIGDHIEPFTGEFDGNTFEISNLSIHRPTQEHIGLFGQTSSAKLTNISLVDIDIKGSSYTGGLVGGAYSGTDISNSSSTGYVEGTSNRTGGLVGFLVSSDIFNSYSSSSVYGKEGSVGGLVGYSDSGTISNSYATGKITGSDIYTGGLIGYARGSRIKDTYSTGDVIGHTHVGGLIGRAYANTSIVNSYSVSVVSGSGTPGGFVGSSANTSSKYSYWSSSVPSSALGLKRTEEEMKTKSTYLNWDFDDVWKIDEGKDYPKLR